VTTVENATGVASTPASWYPCPVDSRLLRWWDGTVWTAHTMDVAATPDAVAEAVVEVAQAEAEVTVSVRAAWSPVERKRDFEMPSYTPMGSVARPSEAQMLSLLVGTSATTGWVWLMAATPLAHAGSVALIAVTVDSSADWGRFLWAGLTVLLYPLFAHGDGRELRRRRLASVAGAWGLLPPVYLSLRTARVGRSSVGPLISWIVLTLAASALVAARLLP